MSFSYGLTNPSSAMISKEVTPDLFKFYANYPKDTSQSTVANQRHPQLYTSLNGGMSWINESASGVVDCFNDVNYGGNFYFNSSNGNLEALGHKAADSSYDANKATVDWNGNTLGVHTWTKSSTTVPSSTTNTPNKEICRSFTSTTYPNRFFCIKDGGGYAYNDDALNTANWTATSFNISSVVYPSDGGFRHICIDSQDSDSIMVLFATNNSNKYLRVYLCNPNTLALIKDYTATALGNTSRKMADYKYISIDYLPNVGYLIFYAYQSDNRFQVRILRTFNETTGQRLSQSQFVADSHGSINVGGSNNKIVANGNRGFYCSWTKEYYFLPNPYQVFWSKDGVNWSSSTSTGLSATTTCYTFLTDGINMVVAGGTNSYVYSNNKGTTWTTGSTLSPDAFYLWGPNDRMILPFKCINNLFRVQPSVTLGYWLNRTDGQPTSNSQNFYVNDYFSVNANTSYVFYGINKTTNNLSHNNRITWYDNNKNWISTQDDTVNGKVPALFTSPSNAAFARFSSRPISGTTVTQQIVDSYKWYFAKESDFKVMTEYGDIVCN